MEPLRRIDTTPIHQRIQLQIKEYILANGLRPGDLLPSEAQLTEQLGVSRPVVREALRSLESLGLVCSRRGGGRYVGEFSLDPIVRNLSYSMLSDMDDVRDLLEVRKRLEASFVADAIAAMDEGTLLRLRQIVDSMRQKEAAGAPNLFEEDVAFHQALYSVIDNRLLIKLLDVFWHVVQYLRRTSLPPAGPLGHEVRNHEEILRAIEAKDVELARERLVRHFEAIEGQLGVAQGDAAGGDQERDA